MNPFRTQIRKSIHNPCLQAALDANAERRLQGRLSAFAGLPDHQQRRQRAHLIREEVINHLDVHLGQFLANVQANGILVHRAEDAARAVRIVLDIINNELAAGEGPGDRRNDRHGARTPKLVAKSKSMLSEEINLNHALERAGIHAVETDLGEYIVQLRGERPSHIITPAVHLRRQEVGRLFAEKLGIPYTEDIPTLTDTARRVLREVFLTAQVGLSGVNFGVAETGSLCVVTNEGNGRMVTTLPRVHIALMGMERLVPGLEDLTLMLSLLPRSATGQKLSVYTSLINAPLPGQERHLILVDNGRTRLRESPLRESLYCIRCGACLNACPVFREIGGHAYVGADGSPAPYPGPIGSVLSPGLFDCGSFGHLAQASSLCGACKEACPVDIDLPGLLLKVRGGEATHKETDGKVSEGIGISSVVRLGLKAMRLAAGVPGFFGLCQRLAGILSTVISPRSAYLQLPAFTGWGYSKDLPRPASRPFRFRWRNLKDGSQCKEAGTPKWVKPSNKRDALVESAGCVQSKERIEQFTEELSALGGQVIACKASELPRRVTTLLNARSVERVQMSGNVPGLSETDLVTGGIRVGRSAYPHVRLGITSALVGIAESGSLVITSDEEDSLTASLLPEIHLAVIRRSQVVMTLDEALRKPEVRESAASVIISGPSRTADIEMTLTIGVHGPGELIVFLIDD